MDILSVLPCSVSSVNVPIIIMKLAVFFILAALALASASPVPEEPIKILKSSFDLDPAGAYNFGYETENKITHEEVGEVKSIKNEEGKDEQVVVVKGSFSYVNPEGTPIKVTYFADETGFHADGEHLPVAPVARK